MLLAAMRFVRGRSQAIQIERVVNTYHAQNQGFDVEGITDDKIGFVMAFRALKLSPGSTDTGRVPIAIENHPIG